MNTGNTKEKQISKAVIKRLPRYRRYLGELKKKGIEKISSDLENNPTLQNTIDILKKKINKQRRRRLYAR